MEKYEHINDIILWTSTNTLWRYFMDKYEHLMTIFYGQVRIHYDIILWTRTNTLITLFVKKDDNINGIIWWHVRTH